MASPRDADDRGELSSPARIGPFAVGRRIGSGGMAVVFAARQETNVGVARLVALKVLHATVTSDAEQRSAFRREAMLATRLEHPSIVRTYDVGEHGGQLYMAMEFAHGVTLGAATSEPCDLKVVLRIVRDVAEALHYAHELAAMDGSALGIIHQDVTPHNIIVGYDGRVRLLDFGVARLGAIDSSRTDTVRGKPAYLAPEQLEGQRLDRRVDVFALGILLHELVTGRRLFRRETLTATYSAILLDPVPDVRVSRPDVPADLAEVIACALRRDPDARFATAAALAHALEEVARLNAIAEVSDAALAKWVHALAAPSFAPADLEREIVSRASPEVTGVAERPTLTPRPANIADRATIPAPISFAPPPAPPDEVDAALPPMAMERFRARAIREVRAGRGWMFLAIPLFFGAIIALGVRVTAAARRVADSPASVSSSSPSVPIAAATPLPSVLPTVPAPSPITSVAQTAIPLPPSKSAAHGQARAASHVVPPTTVPVATFPEPPAAPATPPAAIADASPGYLSVWSNVWGHVVIDGRTAGDSPLAKIPLTAGTHGVKIVTDRGEQSRNVDVRAGETAPVRFVF